MRDEGVLVGKANGIRFPICAGSGGRAGSKISGVANNPYQTPRKYPNFPTGGPLPTGPYAIEKPLRNYKSFGRWATLAQPAGVARFGRGGFGVHGREPIGSQGCIVPLNPAELHRLMDALDADAGGTLYVLDAMGGSLV